MGNGAVVAVSGFIRGEVRSDIIHLGAAGPTCTRRCPELPRMTPL
jgi:hypothetical protein